MVLLAPYNGGNIDWISYFENLIMIGDVVLFAGYFCAIATSLALWAILKSFRNHCIIVSLTCKVCRRSLSSARPILLYTERMCCETLQIFHNFVSLSNVRWDNNPGLQWLWSISLILSEFTAYSNFYFEYLYLIF